MTILQAIILAVVQGLTEFLPVSSKTHIALASKLLGIENISLEIVVALHVGTLLAVFIFYRQDLWGMLKSLFFRPRQELAAKNASEYRRLFGLLLIGTIPAAIAGILLEDKLEAMLNNVRYLGIGLLITATFLFLSGRLKGYREFSTTGPRQAFLIGCAQAAALLPGISRSGSTITGALGCGLSREWAPRFSFLLSVPAILGGAGMKLIDMVKGESSGQLDLLTLLISIIVSGIVGYLAILWVTDSVRRGNLIYFSAYCAIVGVCVLIFAPSFPMPQ